MVLSAELFAELCSFIGVKKRTLLFEFFDEHPLPLSTDDSHRARIDERCLEFSKQCFKLTVDVLTGFISNRKTATYITRGSLPPFINALESR